MFVGTVSDPFNLLRMFFESADPFGFGSLMLLGQQMLELPLVDRPQALWTFFLVLCPILGVFIPFGLILSFAELSALNFGLRQLHLNVFHGLGLFNFVEAKAQPLWDLFFGLLRLCFE